LEVLARLGTGRRDAETMPGGVDGMCGGVVAGKQAGEQPAEVLEPLSASS
jgi:hypothetical protein